MSFLSLKHLKTFSYCTQHEEEFEAKTGEKYRRRTKVLEERLRQNFEQIQKWKEEL